MTTIPPPRNNHTLADLPDAIRATAALLRRAETSRCNAAPESPAILSPLEIESLLHLIELAAGRLETELRQ